MGLKNFKDWMAQSTIDEKKELAIKARTKLITLYHLQQEYRNASADMAGRIEQGVKSINRRKRHTPLPEVLRGDLCETCSKCRFYREGDCK
jgi:hypothetical protein